MEVGSEFDTMNGFTRGKEPRYALKRRLGWPRRRYERFGEKKNHLPLPRLEHRIVENCALPGYYAASSGNFLPTFRDTCLS